MRIALKVIAVLAALVLSAVAWPGPGAVSAASCTPTGFVRDGIDLTAAVVASPNTSYAAAVDAAPCNVAVYVGPGVTGVDVSAEVYGANYFGVLVNGGGASLKGANIHDIGESPFNGTQHGVGVYFVGGATGLVTDSTVSAYQKGGIVANGSGTSVTITGNSVTGLGRVNFIAQNGIQVSRGAVAQVRGNSISDNFYTGTVGVGPNPGGQNPLGWEYVSGGLLLYQAGPGTKHSMNRYSGNQRNVLNVP